MKQVLLLVSSFFIVNFIFAQPQWVTSGNNLYNYLPGYVGIGTAPNFPLDVAGTIHSSYALIVDQWGSGAIGGWFRAPANTPSNVVIQGGNLQAWWITGANGYLYLGGNGGTQPTQGAINIDYNGNVGVGTLNTTAGYKFAVNGTAVFDGVTVKSFSSTGAKSTPWADYVFARDYRLPTLASLSAYINANNHLPGIPTTAEVEKNGLDLGVMQAKLLGKIEELTLYTIDLQKQVDSLKAENAKYTSLQQQIDELKKRL